MPTVLITGANRGIGLDLVKRYSKQGWDIIAAVRDPLTMPSVERVKVVKIVSDSETDAHDVAKELKAQGVTLDVVIANAAINTTKASFSELKTSELEHVFRTNVSGVMILFQAMKDLIPKGGKFTAISSGAGTINMPKAAGQPAYGLSKAALNFMIRSMHFENPNLVIVALNPGWVRTDMGNQGAIWDGMKEAPKSMDETIPGLMKNIENATRDNYGGYMIEWDGSRMEF